MLQFETLDQGGGSEDSSVKAIEKRKFFIVAQKMLRKTEEQDSGSKANRLYRTRRAGLLTLKSRPTCLRRTPQEIEGKDQGQTVLKKQGPEFLEKSRRSTRILLRRESRRRPSGKSI